MSPEAKAIKQNAHARKTERMGNESIIKLLWEFGIPATVGLLVNALYNIVDSIFIGRGVGSLGLAAATAAFPPMIMMMAFGMLVGGGGNALMAIKLGEKKYDTAEKILGNSLTLIIIISAVVTGAGLIFLEPVLRFSGATAEVMPMAKEYTAVIFYGMIAMCIGFGMNNFIRTTGSPKRAMTTMLIGAAVNVVLDYLFIMVFGWGVAGAAWATIIGQFVSAVVVLQYFLSKKAPLKLHLGSMKLEAALVKSILALGFASFIMQVASSFVNVVLNSRLAKYGATTSVGAPGALAAMGVVSKTAMFFLMPIMGFVMAAQPIIGYNYGAQRFDRVKKTFTTAVVAVTSALILCWAGIQLFPHVLTSLFGLKDSATATFATSSLKMFLLLMPLIGFQMLGANYFQSTGQPRKSAILSLSRQVLFLIPALVIVPWAIGYFGGSSDEVLRGVVYATPISDLGSTLLTAVFIVKELTHLDAAHARKIEPVDLDGDGVDSVFDHENVAFLPPTEL